MASTNEDQKAGKESEPQDPSPPEEEIEKWGTHVMGLPAAPTVHPDNQQADHDQQPYVVFSPVEKSADSPFLCAVNTFNSWGHKAEERARNIWHNLKTGPSVSRAALGKVNLTAKAITEGGLESLFKQIFQTDPNEMLKKSFACYLSTTTGPVAGTLYLSTARVGFCGDRPLYCKTPSGQEAWSYYKVTIPLGNIENVENVNPVTMSQNPAEKHIHIMTVDGHDFWFKGFVNFEKASGHLLDAVSNSKATPTPNVS